MSSDSFLQTLPEDILRLFFRYLNSNTDAICLALTCQNLYLAYLSTGALKNFNFGSRVACFNSLRARGVPRDLVWMVLEKSGRGPPGYENDSDSDSDIDWWMD